MPNRSLIMRLRCLPEGKFQEARETGWDGDLLYLTLPEGQPGLPAGSLAEIESESNLYLGQVRHCSGSEMRVQIEHSLNLARLASIQDTWG